MNSSLSTNQVLSVQKSNGIVAGVLFFALAAQFMTVIMLAAAMAPGYDYARGAISDLGNVPATALLFNISLLVAGTFNLAGGVLLWRDHRKAWLLALFILASVGAIGAALMPLGVSGWHGIFALFAFLFFNGQTIGSAAIVEGPMRWVALLLGTIGLAYVAVMVAGDSGITAAFGPFGHGGAERLIVYPPMIWLIAFGGQLMSAR
jgi:hypothetical membrane protein